MQMKTAAQREGERPDSSIMYIVGHHGVATFKDFEGGKCTLCRHMVEKAKAANIPQNVILRLKVFMFDVFLDLSTFDSGNILYQDPSQELKDFLILRVRIPRIPGFYFIS